MSKYYIPEIEEFHVGFELDLFSEAERKWVDYVVSTDSDFVELGVSIIQRQARVKHLDQEDIESLGWVFNELQSSDQPYGWTAYQFGDNKYLELWAKEFTVEIEETGPEGNQTRFDGKIKNKSELKRIMKMVGIS